MIAPLLSSSYVSLSYFIFAVLTRKCLGKQSCMSSSFPISILNGACTLRSAIKVKNYGIGVLLNNSKLILSLACLHTSVAMRFVAFFLIRGMKCQSCGATCSLHITWLYMLNNKKGEVFYGQEPLSGELFVGSTTDAVLI